MTRNRNSRKLRHYLVRKDIQIRMLVINLMYMVCIALAACAIILYPLIELMYQSPFMEVQYHASRFFLVIAERLPLVLGVFLLIFSFHCIVMTHRIFGPLTNFTATFHRLMQGDLTGKVHLRKSDYLKREASDINRMIDALALVLMHIKKENDALMDALTHLPLKTAAPEERKSSEEALQTALQHAETISRIVAHYKIDPAVDAVPSGKQTVR